MTDKSVQKLSKRELLEILVSQGKQIEKLQEELKMVSEQLESKEINIENAGSIAEASLMVNNIFADADAACQQYLDNIMLLEQQQQEALERISEKEAEVDQLLSQTRNRTGQSRRTMPSWTNSRMVEQPVDDSAWAPEPAQPTRAAASRTTTARTTAPRAASNTVNTVRTASTATRTTATASRSTATPVASRTTVAATTPAQNRATAARTTTATVSRQTQTTRTTAARPAQTTVSTAAPRTKRRAS